MNSITLGGLILIDFLALPLIYFIIFQRRLKNIFVLIKFYFLSCIIALVFMFRKRIEYILFIKNPDFLFVITILQLINASFEEFAKLILIFIFYKAYYQKLKEKSTFLIWSFFIGICYGIGEAISLTIFIKFPGIARYFKIFTFGSFVTSYFIIERLVAILIHGIISLIIGFGVLKYILTNKKLFYIILYFIIGIFSHIIVDGFLIILRYYPSLVKYYPSPPLFHSGLLLMGIILLIIIFMVNKKFLRKEVVNYG